MPQSLAQIYLHIVFSTKHRTPFLIDRDLRNRAHAYLGGTCRNLDSPALKSGGVEDHVHILCRLSKTLSVSDLVRELKRDSSQRIKEMSADLAGFYWQAGYGAFSKACYEPKSLRGDLMGHGNPETVPERRDG
jgi:putative transposase